MLLGFWRGLVYEVLSLIGWVAAFVVAQWLAPDVVVWLPMIQGAPQSIQYAVAFAVVFLLTVLVAGFVSWLSKKLVLVRSIWVGAGPAPSSTFLIQTNPSLTRNYESLLQYLRQRPE